MTLKEEAWKQLLENLNIEIEERVSNEITASEIKEITGKEPRLVASMDSRRKVPKILGEMDAFVLPVRNGVYRLVKGEGFQDIEPIEGDPKNHISSLSFDLSTAEGRGEDKYVQYSFNTGLISRFTGIDDLFQTSVGRTYSDPFSFYVGESREIQTKSVQFQVDGLFEGEKDILIFEAKVGKKESFLVRQLYYPFRHYEKNSNKQIKPFFFIYDEEEQTYNFREYEVAEPSNYESLVLKNIEKFRIVEEKPELEDFEEIDRGNEIGWRVPQADSVEKIQEFPFAVKKNFKNITSIAKYFDFARRQSSYYRRAMETLGLVDTRDHEYALTELGEKYVNMRPDKRNKLLAKRMLRVPIVHEVFHKLIDKYVKNLGEEDVYLSRGEIASIIEDNTDLSGATPNRRARTILSWFKWISEYVGIVTERNGNLRLRTKSL